MGSELVNIVWQCLLVFVFSAVLTGIYRHFAKKKSVLDIPEARSSHFRLITRGGGLAVVISFIGVILLNPPMPNLYWSLVLGGGLIALIGFIDDLSHIPPQWRLLYQAIAVLCPVILIHGGAMPFPAWIAFPLTFIALIWLLNLFNFMDGIDAIAGTELFAVAFAIALLLINQQQFDIATYLLILGFAVLGFLAWNMPPARIFMGDVGSSFLGFVIGVFALYTVVEGMLNIFTWLIMLACFIGDTTFTLMRRMIRGDAWYEGHCTHSYQKAALLLAKKSPLPRKSRQRAYAHRVVIGIIALINLFWLLPLAWLAENNTYWGLILTLLAYAPVITIAIWLDAGIPEESRDVIHAKEA